eukprot:COSAG03_NODE_61_length_15487_cov_34.600143_10_plen_110_part_00
MRNPSQQPLWGAIDPKPTPAATSGHVDQLKVGQQVTLNVAEIGSGRPPTCLICCVAIGLVGYCKRVLTSSGEGSSPRLPRLPMEPSDRREDERLPSMDAKLWPLAVRSM